MFSLPVQFGKAVALEFQFVVQSLQFSAAKMIEKLTPPMISQQFYLRRHIPSKRNRQHLCLTPFPT